MRGRRESVGDGITRPPPSQRKNLNMVIFHFSFFPAAAAAHVEARPKRGQDSCFRSPVPVSAGPLRKPGSCLGDKAGGARARGGASLQRSVVAVQCTQCPAMRAGRGACNRATMPWSGKDGIDGSRCSGQGPATAGRPRQSPRTPLASHPGNTRQRRAIRPVCFGKEPRKRPAKGGRRRKSRPRVPPLLWLASQSGPGTARQGGEKPGRTARISRLPPGACAGMMEAPSPPPGRR
jgi:hypothetical protein